MSDKEWNELRRNTPKTSKLISDFENLAVENLESRPYGEALELIRESSAELSALHARIADLETFLHRLEEDRFCDNDGRGCGTGSRVYYFFRPEEQDWTDCDCGDKSVPFVTFPATCSICGRKR